MYQVGDKVQIMNNNIQIVYC